MNIRMQEIKYMNNKQIITTNILWYKIRNLFRKCFTKNNEDKKEIKTIHNNFFK